MVPGGLHGPGGVHGPGGAWSLGQGVVSQHALRQTTTPC